MAALRFRQEGLAAELYADTPEQLDRVLPYVPPHPRLPTVHLNRGLNMLRDRDRDVVEEFAGRFAGRLSGLVVHDQPEMGGQTENLVTALRDLDRRLARALPGHRPRLVSGQAHARFAREHPGLSLQSLSPADERLPGLVNDIQDAVLAAPQDIVAMTRSIGQLGKRVHFHLHDGHPLVGGLPDHFTFLMRLPVPFSHEGRQSLAMMYGPAGLAAIVAAATDAIGLDLVSLTLEIHQVEGRLPVGDADGLFAHWHDLTNAERMNYWLSVLAQNALLVRAAIPA